MKTQHQTQIETMLQVGTNVPESEWSRYPVVEVENHHMFLYGWINHRRFDLLRAVKFTPDPTPYREIQLWWDALDKGFTVKDLDAFESRGAVFRKCKIYNRLTNFKVLGDLGT